MGTTSPLDGLAAGGLTVAVVAVGLAALLWRYRAQALFSPGGNVGRRRPVPTPPGALPLLGARSSSLECHAG